MNIDAHAHTVNTLVDGVEYAYFEPKFGELYCIFMTMPLLITQVAGARTRNSLYVALFLSQSFVIDNQPMITHYFNGMKHL